MDIAESAINAEKIYSVITPQSWTQKQSVTAAKYLGTDYDPYTFSGGRKAVSASGAFTSPTDYVTKYNWRYGSVYYPSAPIELNQDSTVALLFKTYMIILPLILRFMWSRPIIINFRT